METLIKSLRGNIKQIIANIPHVLASATGRKGEIKKEIAVAGAIYSRTSPAPPLTNIMSLHGFNLNFIYIKIILTYCNSIGFITAIEKSSTELQHSLDTKT
ncbi:unnamed protein product [Meganyctiphanes norvegica]|uniref:Uncharacterized protein n=1 Tax=Meganyctiphanes norvegica TaxID=48144 RepID=A0AAV2PQL9_MEGNR